MEGHSGEPTQDTVDHTLHTLAKMEASGIVALLCLFGLTTVLSTTTAISNDRLTILATSRLNPCGKAILR